MNVLSLFDGMSCGRIALERSEIKVDNYYASELDKYAIKVTQANWPETIQLGDVTKWREWDIDWSSIDLLIGGSPCQGFSFAGKQLAFDDPRSKLFFVYSDILTHIDSERDKAGKKEVKFLLENVKMKKEYLEIISDYLGVKPVFINSSLVSAQNRQRYYWANWDFQQPEDKGVLLSDILQVGVDANYDVGGELDKKYADGDQLNPSYKSQANTIHRDKAATICAGTHGYVNGYVDKKYYLSKKAEAYINQPDRIKKKLTSINGEKSICLMSQYDQSKNGTFLCVDSNGRLCDEKTGPITQRYAKGVETHGSNPFIYEESTTRFRKLTPIECERLQTVPDNYTNHVSNTQRYKMLGNGWTVDVIAHIFKSIPNQKK